MTDVDLDANSKLDADFGGLNTGPITGLVKGDGNNYSAATEGVDYAAANHNHNNTYAVVAHDHNNTYAVIAHNHNGTYLTPNGSANNLTNFPTLNQNTTGTAANLSGTPALPNGTTATTQNQSDNSTKLATTAYVDAGLAAVEGGNGVPGGNTTEVQFNLNNNFAGVSILTYANNALTLNGEMALSANGSFTGLTGFFVSTGANNGDYSGLLTSRVAGENLAFGDIVYYKNDSKVYKSNATNSAGMLARGVVCVAANNGNNATVLTYGSITFASFNFAVGNLVYPSMTAGTLTDNVSAVNSNNAIVQPFGWADKNNCVFVNPSLVGITVT